ncbi:unnamed protein product [Rotaria magnacalcarata]|uniref:Uncharacterized protein n=1 Tax=Rotaria magnacalcarata TaxID=392030 RepID=A0A819S3V5_9BILA|nr:unnamed protein product [Rotaria magnacalcarata]CAF2159626.1 unnamed protein product [Rotaria magnacalcarata]CAF4040144.1 unnamed protein product [Rotaria magnacalcarata]CAF4056679.1 unnamed protein product [Rotaria magnacalcarata]
MLSRHQNLDVYLLFKKIGHHYYVESIRISHWQVVCHFKDTNSYKCYELQTDNGDKGGNISYLISDFNFNGTIYYYYVGQCSMSEEELQHNCSQIRINNIRYVLGLLDCQTWATLFIESLNLSVNGVGSFLAKVVCDGSLYRAQTVVARIPDLIVDMDTCLKSVLSRVKMCDGYRNLDPTHKIPFS